MNPDNPNFRSPDDWEKKYTDLVEQFKGLQNLCEGLAIALEKEPIEVVGSTKDGRPLHKYTRHEHVSNALNEYRAKYPATKKEQK